MKFLEVQCQKFREYKSDSNKPIYIHNISREYIKFLLMEMEGNKVRFPLRQIFMFHYFIRVVLKEELTRRK